MTQKNLFEVIVVAPMSAGKSTFINALIGQELLHSANEATTATITRIHDKDNLKTFSGAAYDYSDKLVDYTNNVDADLLKDWNTDDDIKTIDLIGDIRFLSNTEHAEIVIYDTPGPNNSQDERHESLTMEIINDGNYGLILYILNATQIGVQGDYNLLDKIQKTLKNDPAKKILFLLNKADQLDSDKGETLPSVIANVQKYLTNIGFKQPDIVPLSVQATLLAQKALNEENLTRSELSSLANNLSFLDNDEFINSAIVPSKTKSALLKKQQKISDTGELIIRGKSFSIKSLKQLKTNSGFELIKMMLQQYLPDTQHHDKPQKKISKSIQIQIEHNPFTIETVFLIDGQATAENTFEHYKTTRIQRWVEELFTDLEEYFKGIKDFEITFKGVEADWLDLVYAADDASRRGFNINMTHISTREGSERLADIQALMEEAKDHPIFGEQIRNSEAIQKNLSEANNRDFDVYVAGTMSAGKSTFINAMLGCELLPAANEATTATIATITDNDNHKVGEFRGQRINKDDQIVDEQEHVTLTTMQEWNGKEDTKLIELEGNIINIKKRNDVRLKITDTPGPNNSQDPEHALVTMRHISDSVRNPLIIYLLNGTQLAVKDDKQVLTEIAAIMQKGDKQSKDRFIFVANKMDHFDPEKGETIDKVLINIRTYLESCGIKNPQIYPISAIATLLHRKKMNELKLIKREKYLLYQLEFLFGEPEDENDLLVDFVQHMPLTQTAKSDLENKNLVNIEYRSGVAAIECMIDEYIVKYNVLNRVNRAYQALTTAIGLASDTSGLERIEKQINYLITERSRIFSLENQIKQELSDLTESLITDNNTKINVIERNIRQRINEFSIRFKGTVSKSRADSELNNLKTEVTRDCHLIITELESLHSEVQKNIQEQFSKIFNNRAPKELTSLKQMPQPVLEGIKHQLEAPEQLFDLSLSDDEVDENKDLIRQQDGLSSANTSIWYMPWAYETKFKVKQEVDLVAIWKKREVQIRTNFNSLIAAAVQKLEKDMDSSFMQLTQFMSEEFLKYSNSILTKLLELDKSSKQPQPNKANDDKYLEEITYFKEKLHNIMAL